MCNHMVNLAKLDDGQTPQPPHHHEVGSFIDSI
jgi:hypothetical protein